MTAVIYARYSSDNQREESIEGQIRECTAYAEKNDITIVKHYIDRAISAKTDNRPQFQQMIKDSDKKLFDIVLVWKLDRFARNRYDSARYKTQLKKNGVKLMSATEIISEGPEGIILESVLEGYAEYYSADLAEKVVRGQTENILKGRCNGGRGTFGYTLDSERKFHIDPLASPFVLESFTKYRDGLTMKEIRDWLNENGIKNPVGGEFTYNSVEHMLKNRRYIGELKFRDVVVPDAIPPIVPLELFDDVQEKIAKNKKAPARRKAEDDYLLTTKLHCGCCGALMFGESGTSRTGEVHRYYKCATAKKKKGCKKKTVRKQWLEDLVVNQTMQLVRDDAAMESIIAKVMELQDRENTNLPLYEKQLRDAESGIQNMLNAIQAGILTSSTKERLEQLEETKRELEARIAEEKLAKPKIKEEFIRFWLMRFRKLDMSLKDQRQALVDTFINSIYLYDDKVLITFNYKEGTQTITFEEAAQAASKENGSDLDCFTAPENAVKSKDFMAFLFCKPWVHGFCTVFARSVFSMSDYVGRCIALQSVPFFASGEQCQAELCLHFRVGILEQFQKSRHGDGGFACGGYSLRAGGVGLGIEAAFKLLAQLHTGGLLDMGVGVHQHIRTGVSCGPLHRLDVTAGDHQLVGGTGMPQTVKDDAGELRVCVLPFQELLADEHRLHRQTVGEPQQHPAVAVPLRVEGFFPLQPFQPLLQLLPQGGGHEDGAAGGFGLGVLQDEGGLAALQLVREDAEDAALVHLCQRVLLHPLHGTVDGEGAHAVGGIKVDVLRGQTCHLPFPQRTHQRQVHRQMQDGVLHAVQCCPHLLHLPDAALLGGLFGRFHRDGAFDEDAPLHRQQKGIVQQLVDLMEGSAGEGALLLLGREVSPLAAHILPAGGLAQGVVQGFDVVGPQLLHLHLPDIRDDEVLDERQIGLVGLGCPLVLAALLGQPVHQELCHRHRGRDQEIAGRQLMLDLLLAFDRLLFGGKALPFVAALAVLVLIGVADTVRAAAFRDICHRFASLSSCPVEPRIEAVFRDADASACPQDTELGGAVAQVVGGTLADGQHLCDLLHRVHQLCGLRAVGRRLDGIGSSDHLHCSRIRVRLQGLFRIIQRFHILVHFITHRHCSLLIVAHRRLLRAVLIKSNDLRRDAVQRFQGGFIVLPQLGILQTLQDAPFLRFVQRGRERLVLLFQLFVFGGGLGEGYVVLSQLVLHPCYVGDIAVQHLADLRRTALAVEGGDTHQQGIQLLLLLGQLGHLLEDAGRDVLPPGLAGAFAPFQLRVLLDHVLPELVLPLHKVLAVADDLLGAQPSVSSQGHEAEVQVGRFLVHVDNSREKGIRALSALQKFQGVRKVRPDLPVGLILEKLRAGGDKSLHHPHAVLADTAVGGGYHAVGFFPVPALRLHQMEVVAAPARVDIRVAGVLLLGALVVGFDGADGRPLVLFEP